MPDGVFGNTDEPIDRCGPAPADYLGSSGHLGARGVAKLGAARSGPRTVIGGVPCNGWDAS